MMCRFDMGFVHERILGEKRLFALVTKLEDCGEEDKIVMLPLMNVKNSMQMIIGLPGIGNKPLYVVDTDSIRRNKPAPFGKGSLRLNSTASHCGPSDLTASSSSAALIYC